MKGINVFRFTTFLGTIILFGMWQKSILASCWLICAVLYGASLMKEKI